MLINLKNANICQREGRLVLGNVNLQVNEGDYLMKPMRLPYWGMTC